MKNLLLTTGLCGLIILAFYFGKHLYLRPKNITGDKAAEISDQLPDGSTFSLAALQGKYVLLDFWASWCKPCRQSHPALLELYTRYQNQSFKDADGFEIVSIGLEQNRESWANAIQKDGMIWPYHILSLGDFEAPIVRLYNVRQVPTTFLINPKGIIMAVDPPLDEVAKLLNARSKSTGEGQ